MKTIQGKAGRKKHRNPAKKRRKNKKQVKQKRMVGRWLASAIQEEFLRAIWGENWWMYTSDRAVNHYSRVLSKMIGRDEFKHGDLAYRLQFENFLNEIAEISLPARPHR